MHQMKLTVLFCLALVALSNVVWAEDLIARTCRGTPASQLCESSLQADPRSSKAADAEGLAEILVDVVDSKFTDAIGYVNQLLKASPPPPAQAKALKECLSLFQFVITNEVPSAKQALPWQKMFAVAAMDSSAEEAIDCGTRATSAGAEPALIQRAKFLTDLCNVTTSICRIL